MSDYLPISPEIRKLVLQIMSLALVIPAAVADVFCQYSAHTQSLDVDIHLGGWVAGQSARERVNIYLTYAEDEVVPDLKKLLKRLRGLQGGDAIMMANEVAKEVIA